MRNKILIILLFVVIVCAQVPMNLYKGVKADSLSITKGATIGSTLVVTGDVDVSGAVVFDSMDVSIVTVDTLTINVLGTMHNLTADTAAITRADISDIDCDSVNSTIFVGDITGNVTSTASDIDTLTSVLIDADSVVVSTGIWGDLTGDVTGNATSANQADTSNYLGAGMSFAGFEAGRITWTGNTERYAIGVPTATTASVPFDLTYIGDHIALLTTQIGLETKTDSLIINIDPADTAAMTGKVYGWKVLTITP